MAYKGSRGIAPLVLSFRQWWTRVVTLRPRLLPGRKPGPIEQEAGWGQSRPGIFEGENILL